MVSEVIKGASGSRGVKEKHAALTPKFFGNVSVACFWQSGISSSPVPSRSWSYQSEVYCTVLFYRQVAYFFFLHWTPMEQRSGDSCFEMWVTKIKVWQKWTVCWYAFRGKLYYM